MADLPNFQLPSSRVPGGGARQQFFETIKELPVGTKVKANVYLFAKLGKSRAGRGRDPDIIGVVKGYDELQLRVLIRWDHPDYKEAPADSRGNLEPLPPFYIDPVVEA